MIRQAGLGRSAAPGLPVGHRNVAGCLHPLDITRRRIQPLEPVSENPSFTLDLRAAAPGARLHVAGRDNNGNRIDAWVTR